MARRVKNPKIDSRSARAKLTVRAEPYWTVIERGRAVGYRKGKKSGGWIARLRDQEGKQHYHAIGAADDAMDADEVDILSFAEAQARAREWFEQKAQELSGTPFGPYTVATCLRDYISWMKSEGKAAALDFETRANALIIPPLGTIEAAGLTTKKIREWRDELAASPARKRTRKGETQRYYALPGSDDGKRKRKVTANRTLTILKAALNHAFKEGKIASDLAWRRVKPYRDVEAARVRFLTLEEGRRLINASDPAFRPIVQAALMTGARYGELTRLKVRDFHPDSGSLFVEKSKSQKPRHIVLTQEGIDFFANLIFGRDDPEGPLFRKPSGGTWGRAHQTRPFAEAYRNARIQPSITFHELRHTYASLSIMGGMTLMVLAQNLCHSDTRMVERHYGHLADSYKRDMIRETAPVFGTEQPGNVERLGQPR